MDPAPDLSVAPPEAEQGREETSCPGHTFPNRFVNKRNLTFGEFVKKKK